MSREAPGIEFRGGSISSGARHGLRRQAAKRPIEASEARRRFGFCGRRRPKPNRRRASLAAAVQIARHFEGAD
jgi:hypothetical protein